jgi:hypothetical protein
MFSGIYCTAEVGVKWVTSGGEVIAPDSGVAPNISGPCIDFASALRRFGVGKGEMEIRV